MIIVLVRKSQAACHAVAHHLALRLLALFWFAHAAQAQLQRFLFLLLFVLEDVVHVLFGL